MKTLFNEYEAMNKDGYILNDEVYQLIKPLILKWIDMGFSIYDIEHIITNETAVLCAERRLLKAIEMKHDKDKRKTFHKGEEYKVGIKNRLKEALK